MACYYYNNQPADRQPRSGYSIDFPVNKYAEALNVIHRGSTPWNLPNHTHALVYVWGCLTL